MVDVELDLAARRTIHIVGVGGSIMSAFATVFVRMGHRVSGSDLRESATLDRLRAAGVAVHVGHAAANVPGDADAVIASTAIAASNPEVERARKLGIPVFSRAATQRAIVATRRAVAVAGSHGKTTTSSMLALVLREAGWNPSFLIGGNVNEIGTNAAWDAGEWLVVEADESDGTFLQFATEAAVVTNIEPDHLSYWGDFASLVAGFARFLDEARGPRAVSADDAVARDLAAARTGAVVTFGFADDADYLVRNYAGARDGSEFALVAHGAELGRIRLPAPGRHNAKNAAAAAAIAMEMGVPFDAVQRALAHFGGVARRFQHRGERDGVTFVDDYAHLPGEVTPMIDAAREGDWGRVVVVFQPHRYTRTAALWRDFAHAFDRADLLVLTDIYPADEAPQPGVSGRLILRAVLDAQPALPVVYLPQRADLVEHVPRLTRAGDLVLTLGAGDLTSVPDAWLGEG